MRRICTSYLALFLTVLSLTAGCHPLQPRYLHDHGDLSGLLEEQLKIDYPDVQAASLADASESHPPLTVSDPKFDNIWDIALEEVIQVTLHNSKVIRNLASVTPIGFADGLVQRSGNSTVYDPAITATAGSSLATARPGPGLTISGDQPNRITAASAGGTESALAAYDAQLSVLGASGGSASGTLLGRTDRPVNTTGQFTGFPVVTEANDGGLRMDLAKKTATGASFAASSVSVYSRSNRRGSFQAVPSNWLQFLEVKAEHHLLQGRGTQINRIPVVLARINEDISLTAFEIAVRNELLDVENTYWDLHYAYRSLEAAKQGRDAAQWAWQKIQARREGQVDPADAEAQARAQYFSFRVRVEAAQINVFEIESRLRWLMGIAPADGRLIRPIDEPATAKLEFEWTSTNLEALFQRAEVRQQKWQLKQRELELIAARNRLLPVLDVGATYRWLGMGDELINADRNGLNFPSAGSTAFDELTEGNYQEFDVFFSFGMPVGYRRELAAVRNAQLQVARSKAVLEDMELNTTHLLSSALRTLDGNYVQANSNLNRLQAADEWTDVISTIWSQGGATGRDTRVLINQLLNAINERAAAYDEYYRIVCAYNKSIANLHFTKGSLLEYNGVQLAEGPWPEKAYWDAMAQARKRNASRHLDYGWTRPDNVSQAAGTHHLSDSEGLFPGVDQSLPVPPAQDGEQETPETESTAPPASAGNPASASRSVRPVALEEVVPERKPRSGTYDWGKTSGSAVIPAVKNQTVDRP